MPCVPLRPGRKDAFMNDSLVCKRYELAQQVYAAHGVDTEQAMAAIDAIPISMHSWQAG